MDLPIFVDSLGFRRIALAARLKTREPRHAKLQFVLAFILLTATDATVGQNHVPSATPRYGTEQNSAKFNPEIQAIIDAADIVAPEFGADALMRVVESGMVQSPSTRIMLLEKAFALANGAEHPVKRDRYHGDTDTRAGLLAYAFDLNLDKISLQSRAVDDILPLNASKARQLFEQIDLPKLAPIPCEQALTYNVNAFYKSAGNIARDGLTAKQKLSGQRLTLLMPLVTLQSHAQVEPAAELLSSLDIGSGDLEQLSNAFAFSLSQLNGDERSFEIVNSGGNGVLDPVQKLMAALKKSGISTLPVLQALRQYLVSNFAGVQCGDAMEEWAWLDDAVKRETSLPMEIDYFNHHFLTALQHFQIAPISSDEIKAASEGPKRKDIEYWQSSESKRLMADVKGLRFGSMDRALTVAERQTPEWNARLTDFLTEMEGWDPDNESSEIDFFNEKGELYFALIELVPPGSARWKIIDRFVDFMQQSSTLNISRVEWLQWIPAMFSRLERTGGLDQLIQALLNSTDPALRLYAQLERLRLKHGTAELSHRERAKN